MDIITKLVYTLKVVINSCNRTKYYSFLKGLYIYFKKLKPALKQYEKSPT